MSRQMLVSSQGRQTSLDVFTLCCAESLLGLRFGGIPVFLQGLNELLSRPSFVQFAELNEFLSFPFPPPTSLLLLTMCSRKIGSYSMKSLLSLHQKEDLFVNLHFQEDVTVFK